MSRTYQPAPIRIRYEALDGFTERRSFYSLKGAQRYAEMRLGTYPELGSGDLYAVSPDGVGKLEVEGCMFSDLWPAVKAARADPPIDTRKPGFNGRPVEVYEDGSDNYTGEDDLTEAAIENRYAGMDAEEDYR